MKKKKYVSTITLATLKIFAQELSDEYLDHDENLFASQVLTRLMVKVFNYIEKQNTTEKETKNG